ncbi:glycosyltransferase [Ferruginibacter paludis]|uniref:glycosyltransferase n=1 Tax=Ferruginibacter paludis TaxID=1310417 RepID=UPI0025B48474|nr:glycosyltransferase [Ferruginibacter paludis]MDN3656086.1 glycosyltransferase [Ferruginibacter paludis]
MITKVQNNEIVVRDFAKPQWGIASRIATGEGLINKKPVILFINSYPPRQCGLATYSYDLITALENKFDASFSIKICAVENNTECQNYEGKVEFTMNTDHPESFPNLVKAINNDTNIKLVLIQHEFGFFKKCEEEFLQFFSLVDKPIITVFHTVLPYPDEILKVNVQAIAQQSESIVVMTQSSLELLMRDYLLDEKKITVIPHGTHLVPHTDRSYLKRKYNLSNKTILSTFGLLSSGKGIEITLEALPAIVAKNKNVLFLIIGKTHPGVVLHEGEKYRKTLEEKVVFLHLENHVQFINQFLSLPQLLEYLQLTDIYLFTSKDPNQAVSGTFSYAMSCGCAIVTTPIPHAIELIKNEAALAVDFENPTQLSTVVIKLLKDEELRKKISLNALHKMAPTAWENSAISYAILFENVADNSVNIKYSNPKINLNHLKRITTNFGIVQFSEMNVPDLQSGYTLDDNARGLVAMCQHYELTNNPEDVDYIFRYFNFIKFCLQHNGYFLNYVDENKNFTKQNFAANLEDSNGRAIWALGYMISTSDLLPVYLQSDVKQIIAKALSNKFKINSPRAMGFIIKGLYYCNTNNPSEDNILLIKTFANRLVQMYRHESENDWKWFESYLTYGNSILPEALLCAWLATGETIYKQIAKASFDFLLLKTFSKTAIKVVSNKGWLQKNEAQNKEIKGGEQPIDIAYTILALDKFHKVFSEDNYDGKMNMAFSWFQGNNHLHRIIYNPCTGGCYDGLEDTYVNLNQGAESTLSYLMARLTMETYFHEKKLATNNLQKSLQLPG